MDAHPLIAKIQRASDSDASVLATTISHGSRHAARRHRGPISDAVLGRATSNRTTRIASSSEAGGSAMMPKAIPGLKADGQCWGLDIDCVHASRVLEFYGGNLAASWQIPNSQDGISSYD